MLCLDRLASKVSIDADGKVSAVESQELQAGVFAGVGTRPCRFLVLVQEGGRVMSLSLFRWFSG